MAITTAYDPNNYLQTTKKILDEFLKTYFTAALGYDAEISIVRQTYATPFSKPLIRVDILDPSRTDAAAGKAMYDSKTNACVAAGKVRLGEFRDIIFSILVITDKTSGAEYNRDKYSAYLEQMFLRHSDLLGIAKLRRVTIGPPLPMDTERFFQNLHELGVRLEIYFDR